MRTMNISKRLSANAKHDLVGKTRRTPRRCAALSRNTAAFLNMRSRVFSNHPPTGTTQRQPRPCSDVRIRFGGGVDRCLTDIGHQLYVQPHRRAEFIVMMREHGKVAEFESQIYRRDRSIIWISENARAVHDEVSHELLYYEGLVQDITHHKRAEEAHRKPKRARMPQYAVTHALAEARHLSEAAGKIVRAICEGLGWDFGDLWCVDETAGVLRCVDMWHLPARRSRNLPKPQVRSPLLAASAGRAGCGRAVSRRGLQTW